MGVEQGTGGGGEREGERRGRRGDNGVGRVEIRREEGDGRGGGTNGERRSRVHKRVTQEEKGIEEDGG
jgi:hypothetical protein